VVGCERAEPTSYRIPKEVVEEPEPSFADASKQATPPGVATGSAPPNGQMRVLPGMEEAAQEAGELSYTVPEGWEDRPASGIRKANLVVSDASGSAELTVLAFPGDVGGMLANVNRWREQIGLDPITADALDSVAQPYTISAHGGRYVRLEGSLQSILGGLLPFHGYTWFFKLQGDSMTVLANEAAMKTFLDSVRLEDDHH
jgi:hypothetical protein